MIDVILLSQLNLEKLDSSKIFETSATCNRWTRFPMLNSFVRFAVLPKRDIRISFAYRAKDHRDMLILTIGYSDNMKTSLGTLENPHMIERDTPRILKRGYNEFWAIWMDGEMFILKANEKTAFISMRYKPYLITYVGFNTPNGSADWYLREGERIHTVREQRYNYHGIRNGFFQFAYKGKSDARFALFFMGGEPLPPMVEVNLGINNNTESVIRYDNNDFEQVVLSTPQLLSDEHFTIFCIRWKNGRLAVRKDHPSGKIVIESNYLCVDFVPHFFAVQSGHGAAGQWIFGVNDAKAVVDGVSESEDEDDKPKPVEQEKTIPGLITQ